MTDTTPPIGGDSARFMSDGLTLRLDSGQDVTPRVRAPDSDRPWLTTWVDPEAGEVGLGPEADDTRAVLSLSPAKAVFDDEGRRLWHYECNGWWYCDREHEAFDWETGDIECPHCGDEFHAPEPEPVEA